MTFARTRTLSWHRPMVPCFLGYIYPSTTKVIVDADVMRTLTSTSILVYFEHRGQNTWRQSFFYFANKYDKLASLLT